MSAETMKFTENGWECTTVCGNGADTFGFEACDRNGVAVNPDSTYAFVRCLQCGRISDTTTFEVVGRA